MGAGAVIVLDRAAGAAKRGQEADEKKERCCPSGGHLAERFVPVLHHRGTVEANQQSSRPQSKTGGRLVKNAADGAAPTDKAARKDVMAYRGV